MPDSTGEDTYGVAGADQSDDSRHVHQRVAISDDADDFDIGVSTSVFKKFAPLSDGVVPDVTWFVV